MSELVEGRKVPRSCMSIRVQSGGSPSWARFLQNSVLGVLLASQHFANPLTAAPCAVSSVCHSVLGSLLAALWRLQGLEEPDKQEPVSLLSGG